MIIFKQKRKLFLIGSMMILLSSSIHAEERLKEGGTVYNYQQMKKMASEGMELPRTAIDITFNSILDAIFYATAADKMAAGDKYTPFFCTPKDYQMDGADLEGLVDLYIKNNSGNVSQNDKVGLISVLALRDRFPCNKHATK